MANFIDDTDQQIVGLGLGIPRIGLRIIFPNTLSNEDKDAIWAAIYRVEDERGLRDKYPQHDPRKMSQ